MKEKQDYIRDLAEIRSMMERTSKFLSLSGWAGIMAGIYALSGAYIAYQAYGFNPDAILYTGGATETLSKVIFLAVVVFLLAISTATYFSYKKASERGERLWNAASRRLLVHMAIPLVAGGIVVLILLSKGLIGLLAPLTLVFYGLSLYNASQFTFREVRVLGLVQMGLGLLSCYLIDYGLLFWAIGFGFVHIVYGIYMYLRYEQ